jgi:hypothetical protein
MFLYPPDTDHLAECPKPIAECPLCSDFYQLVEYPKEDPS